MPRITALLTCHNRREKTLASLRLLHRQKLPPSFTLGCVLVDDGSSDGTSEAVAGEFPEVEIIRGDGSLFWCGGMRVAWKAAAAADPEFYLLANDDTLLDGNALEELLGLAPTADTRAIAVASIRDPESGVATYGGVREREGLVPPTGKVEECDTFNGNAVLVPRRVFRELGILHDAFTHGMGDFDYGYQATRRGIKVVQSSGFVGECERNPEAGTWRDRSQGRRKRWKQLAGPKGLPFREWMTFNRRNSRWQWPLRTISPYIRVILGL